MEERRRSPRFKAISDVNGRMKSTMKVRIVDLSLHGMLVESPNGLPPNGTFEITVLAPSGEKNLRTEVRWCRGQMVQGDDGVKIRYHAGLEFLDVGEDGLDLTDLISEICTVDGPIKHGGAEVEAEAPESGTEKEDTKGFKFAM